MTNENQTVYIYNNGKTNLEVVLTGRIARKPGRRRDIVLHEIMSKDPDIEFRAWVKLEQLFTIEET